MTTIHDHTDTVTARDQYLIDVFTTALEGGIGYWSYALTYHWSNADGTDDYKGFYADIVVPMDDMPDGDYHVATEMVDLPLAGPTLCARMRIDRTVIARGWKLGATTEVVVGTYYWQCDDRPPLVITDDTEWDFDACDADAIVQYGLFGEVVYG